MTLPYVFANVGTLYTAQMDAVYNAISNLGIIPCTATGTNTIALTQVPGISTTVAAYSSLAPAFVFLAAASASGAVTVNINGIGPKNLYKNNGATAAGLGDIVVGGLYVISYNSALNAAAGGFVLNNPSTSVTAPTAQRLTSGSSATYTATSGTVRQKVRMVGPGGGGGGASANSGSSGSAATSLQVNAAGTAWTAAAGGGGGGAAGASGSGGSGGTDGSTGTLVTRMAGGGGGSGGANTTANVAPASGFGGSTPFGVGPSAILGTPGAPPTNSGAGGGGGGANSATASGSGGGGGEYVEFWVTGMTTATYTIGTGGAGGAAGTNAGRAGASGYIIIEEFYS